MKNTTSIKIPKKYQHMIELVEHDSDGYWAYTNNGFYFPSMECHTAHEWNQKDLLEKIRDIEKCECHECKGEMKGV